MAAKLWIFDPKDDFRQFAIEHQFLVIHPGVCLNLVAPLDFLRWPEQVALFVSVFCKAFYSAEYARQVLVDGLRTTPQSLADLCTKIHQSVSKADTYQRRDACTGVTARLQRIGDRYPNVFRARRGISLETLLNHHVYFPVSTNTEVEQFLFGLLVHYLFAHHRRHQLRMHSTPTYLVMDEGVLSWKPEGRINGAVLDDLTGMIREFNIGLICTVNYRAAISRALTSNMYTQICMNVTDGDEAAEISRTFSFDKDQRTYLEKRLQRGQCIIRLGDRWREPILATFPPSTETKQTTANEWKQLLAATDALAPNEPSEPPTPEHEEQPKIALTKQQEALLRSAATTLLPATVHYQRLQLLAEQGHRNKRVLLRLGLVTQEPVIVRKGRGGRALILVPTPAGYALLGQTPSTGTRGGDSVQHRYLIQELNAVLHATVEARVGTKSVDLLLRHEEPALAAICLGFPLNANDFIAIEVETSNPHTTAPNNARKNYAVGIRLTIIAVLPKDFASVQTTLRYHLTPEEHQHIVVCEVFDLLAALRKGHDDKNR